MAADKTEGPMTCLTFLGIQLDTIAMTASLSADRLRELQQLLAVWEGKTHATIEELQSLTGVLSWATHVVRPGRSFLRRIIDFTTMCRHIGPGPHKLDHSMREDVRWWLDFAPTWNGVSLLYELEWQTADKLRIETDACDKGFGAIFGDWWIAGKWDREQKSRALNPKAKRISMPFFELLALVLAVAAWSHLWPGRRIIFVTDCLPNFHAILNMRSSHPRIAALLRKLAMLAARNGFDFKCQWIAGLTNVNADRLTRGNLQEFHEGHPTANKIADEVATLPRFEDM
jgi:hypothetical protein